MNELWQPIEGYEGLYEVSDQGRVRRVKAAPHTRPGRFLKPMVDRYGYETVGLYLNKKQKWRKVHRLVALAFVHGRDETVDHIDGNKRNNNASNLRWVSQRVNTLKVRCTENRERNLLGQFTSAKASPQPHVAA